MGIVVNLPVEDHVIRFPNGTFYSGKAGVAYMGTREEAFPYTKAGAEAKIARLGKTSLMWRDATVVPRKEES